MSRWGKALLLSTLLMAACASANQQPADASVDLTAGKCDPKELFTACSDQSQAPTEPATPAPNANFGNCQPVRFPIVNVARLIDQVFKGKSRNEALLRAAAVAILWDTCHEAAAQKVAVNFVNWIDLNAPKNAPASKVLELSKQGIR